MQRRKKWKNFGGGDEPNIGWLRVKASEWVQETKGEDEQQHIVAHYVMSFLQDVSCN